MVNILSLMFKSRATVIKV